MKQQIVITDLTRMQVPKVCIAGYSRDERCIRPIIPFQGIGEWFLYKDDCLVIRPFGVVELDFVRHVPEAPHTEDWEINRFHRRLVTAQLPDKKKLNLLERTVSDSVTGIFGAEIHDDLGFYVKAGEGERSLGTVRPAEITDLIYEAKPGDKWDYRIVFKDQAGQAYRLAITDLAYRHYLDYGRGQLNYAPNELTSRLMGFFNQRTTFLRIGLARAWEKFPDRCYLQVTGIHTSPDYLRGRTFVDLVISGKGEDAQQA
jgi:hypothetical protein